MIEKLSVVIPVFNEEPNLTELLDRLGAACAPGDRWRSYEIIIVDDGSTDGSKAVLRARPEPGLKVVLRERRGGQTAALRSGFDAATGDLIATLDGDLQNDPAEIPKLVDALSDGIDGVIGVRTPRRDPLRVRFYSRIANWTRRLVLGDEFSDIGCGLRVFRARCLRNLTLEDGDHRFLPILVGQAGFKIVEMPVSHAPRRHGVSKYTLGNRFFKAAGDLLRIRRLLKGTR